MEAQLLPDPKQKMGENPKKMAGKMESLLDFKHIHFMMYMVSVPFSSEYRPDFSNGIN